MKDTNEYGNLGILVVKYIKSDNWEWGVVTDGASVSLGESDVSLLSPAWGPWVSDDPFAVSETNGDDSVVDGLSAVVEDSTG